MDTRLPLMVQQPNLLGAMAQGTQNASNAANLMRQAEGQNLMRQHGAAAMRGDQNALDAFAGYDVGMAQGIQQNRQTMSINAEKMKMARDQVARSLAAAEDQEAAAREAEEAIWLGNQAFAAWQSGDEAAFKQIADGLGVSAPFSEQGVAMLNAGAAGASMYKAWREAQPEPTAEMRNLDFRAQQAGLEPGTPEYKEFMSSGGRGALVEVNTGDEIDQRPLTGTPPAGYQRRWDEQNKTWVDEPIRGSEAAGEVAEGDRRVQLASAEYNRKYNIVDTNLDKAIQSIQDNGRLVAGYGSLLSGLPESAARDFQATLNTVKANLGFEELQNMRDNSPTGGALGQVSEREIAFLQAIQGNLDAAQSPQQLLEVLREIKTRRAQFKAERERILNGGNAASTSGREVEINGQRYRVEAID